MAKIKYREIRLSPTNKKRLEQINAIISEYQSDNYVLTLRQLYYQLVSRDVIPNQVKEYNKLSILLKEGRMAGIVDWDAIEDRLRRPSKPSAFDSPEDILDACISQYMLPRMEGQKNYLEVWVEKDALSGVLRRVTEKYHIPICVNRGYSSATAMHDAYNRFNRKLSHHQKATVIYLGDFDPSGVDMIRDIKDRIDEFARPYHKTFNFEIVPVALTLAQIKKYDPPVNPAKITDPRAADYIAKYGEHSWEVDALPPKVLHKILEDAIIKRIDLPKYEAILLTEEVDKNRLENLKEHL